MAAFGAAACCALPLVLASAGIGSAWLSGVSPAVAPYRTPLLVLATILLLAAALRLMWQFRQTRACPTDAACASPTYRVLTAVVGVVGAALLAGAILYG